MSTRFKRYFAVLLTTPMSFTPRCIAVMELPPQIQELKDIKNTYVDASRQSALHKIDVIPIDIPKELLK
jgi:peroxiredoxin